MKKIAFLGLGAMGSRMASHLIRSDYQISVWNRSQDATRPLLDKGAVLGESPADTARGADVVFSMLRDDQASAEVWLNKETGALGAMKEGSIAIECSTITPEWSNALADECNALNIRFLAAPVAGSRAQADSANLIFFIGGDSTAAEECEDIFKCMGPSLHYCGKPSSAAMTKLTVNALLGIQVVAIAELIGTLKKSAKMDYENIMSIVASTPVCSPAAAMTTKGILSENFEASFPIELVEKDFRYIAQWANHAGCETPLAHTTLEVFTRAIEKNLEGENITGVAQLF